VFSFFAQQIGHLCIVEKFSVIFDSSQELKMHDYVAPYWQNVEVLSLLPLVTAPAFIQSGYFDFMLQASSALIFPVKERCIPRHPYMRLAPFIWQ
jgi:hypothetical protein